MDLLVSIVGNDTTASGTFTGVPFGDYAVSCQVFDGAALLLGSGTIPTLTVGAGPTPTVRLTIEVDPDPTGSAPFVVTVVERAGTATTTVSAGGNHTCAVVGGSVRCVGYNAYGQLGNNTTTNSSIPVSVSGISGAIEVSAGDAHSCAVMTGGIVQCWGGNSAGQLGNSTTIDSSIPVSVSNISGVIAVSAGDRHSCALMTGGTVQCWGYNGSGQLGNNTTVNSSSPVSMIGIP